LGEENLRHKKEEDKKIIGYCEVCGSPVTSHSIRKVSRHTGKKEILCERCFRKRFVEPRVRLRIYKYTGLFRRGR